MYILIQQYYIKTMKTLNPTTTIVLSREVALMLERLESAFIIEFDREGNPVSWETCPYTIDVTAPLLEAVYADEILKALTLIVGINRTRSTVIAKTKLSTTITEAMEQEYSRLINKYRRFF